MATLQELRFAQKYPFTIKARKVLQEKNFQLEGISEFVIKRSALMIAKASKNELYLQEQISESVEILENEIAA
ncbi:MAG: hypothetical protein Q7K42_06105, partial [Candidatus Diapherotrites archaeon]|nr:hypothetical protein [Candidatus Diapherotrites archaeon]